MCRATSAAKAEWEPVFAKLSRSVASGMELLIYSLRARDVTGLLWWARFLRAAWLGDGMEMSRGGDYRKSESEERFFGDPRRGF